MRKSYFQWTVIATFITILIIVAIASHRSISHLDYSGDARVFVDYTYQTGRQLAITNKADPPLRYVELGLILRLVGLSNSNAVFVANYTSLIASFVLIPLIISYFVGLLVSRSVSAFALCGFIIERASGLTNVAYHQGHWQNALVMPYLLLTLIAAHYTICADDSTDKRSWALLTGILLGISGLHQLALTALTVMAVTIIYLYKNEFRSLIITGISGGILGAPMLFISPVQENTIKHLDQPSRNPLEFTVPELQHLDGILLHPKLIIVLFMIVSIGYLIIQQGALVTESGVLESTLGIFSIVFIYSHIFKLYYWSKITHPNVIAVGWGLFVVAIWTTILSDENRFQSKFISLMYLVQNRAQ